MQSSHAGAGAATSAAKAASSCHGPQKPPYLASAAWIAFGSAPAPPGLW